MRNMHCPRIDPQNCLQTQYVGDLEGGSEDHALPMAPADARPSALLLPPAAARPSSFPMAPPDARPPASPTDPPASASHQESSAGEHKHTRVQSRRWFKSSLMRSKLDEVVWSG